jgi:hypothetical protein
MGFGRRPLGGGPARRALKRTMRREGRRLRRRVRRRMTRRIIVGSSVILCMAGSTAAIKIQQKDAEKIQTSAGKPVDNMTEDEIKTQVKKLGINKIELTPEDQQKVDQFDEKDGNFEESDSVCPNCGEDVFPDAKFCEKCGQKLE